MTEKDRGKRFGKRAVARFFSAPHFPDKGILSGDEAVPLNRFEHGEGPLSASITRTIHKWPNGISTHVAGMKN